MGLEQLKKHLRETQKVEEELEEDNKARIKAYAEFDKHLEEMVNAGSMNYRPITPNRVPFSQNGKKAYDKTLPFYIDGTLRRLQIEMVKPNIFPVGIDKLVLYHFLAEDCVDDSLLKHFTSQRAHNGAFTFKKYKLTVKAGNDNASFIIWLKKLDDRRGRKAGTKSRVPLKWLLTIQLNPSMWMKAVGVKGARKGNHMAGNARALELALDDLQVILDEFGFRTDGDVALPLQSKEMWVSRADIARDLLLRALDKSLMSPENFESEDFPLYAIDKDRTQACVDEIFEVLERYVPTYTKATSKVFCKNVPARHLTDNADCRIYCGPTIRTVRATKSWRMVCYHKYITGRGHTPKVSGQIRFEFRSYTAEKTRSIFGVSSLNAQQVVDELRKVALWHHNNRVGEMPVLEAFIEKFIANMLTSRAKAKLPKVPPFLPQLIEQLAQSDGRLLIDGIISGSKSRQAKSSVSPLEPPSTKEERRKYIESIKFMDSGNLATRLKVGADFTPELKHEVNMFLNSYPIYWVHAEIAAVTGYSPYSTPKLKVSKLQNKLSHNIQLASKHKEKCRQHSVALHKVWEHLRDFDESPSAIPWSWHRDIVYKKLLLKP